MTIIRLLYERTHGKIPTGVHAHHKCGNRWCVNPNHVELITNSEHSKLPKNTKSKGRKKWWRFTNLVANTVYDKYKRDRLPREPLGRKFTKGMLPNDVVKFIRDTTKEECPGTFLSRILNVHEMAISRIRSNRTYKKVS